MRGTGGRVRGAKRSGPSAAFRLSVSGSGEVHQGAPGKNGLVIVTLGKTSESVWTVPSGTTISNDVDILDTPIRHQQSMLEIPGLPIA